MKWLEKKWVSVKRLKKKDITIQSCHKSGCVGIKNEKDWFFQDWLSEKTYRDDLREILVQIHGLPKIFLGIKKKTLTRWIKPHQGATNAIQVTFLMPEKCLDGRDFFSNHLDMFFQITSLDNTTPFPF